MIKENIMNYDTDAKKVVLDTFSYNTQKDRNAALREKEKELTISNPIFPKAKGDDVAIDQTPSFNTELAEAYIANLNTELAEGTAQVRECKSCKKLFVVSKAEVVWYTDQKFELPNKCGWCRFKARKAKENAANKEAKDQSGVKTDRKPKNKTKVAKPYSRKKSR